MPRLPAHFDSGLPTVLGDDTAWCAQAPADVNAAVTAPLESGGASRKAWITQSTDTLIQALACVVWGYSTWSFVAANADVYAWPLKQTGLRSRRIAQGPDGGVIDMLIWSTAEPLETVGHALFAVD